MNLSTIKDETILEEAVLRLKKRIRKKTGMELLFGDLVLTLHEGILKKIEYGVRGRCFIKDSKILKGGHQ